MPDQFRGSQEEWERTDSLLREVDDVLRSFSQTHAMQLTKNLYSRLNRQLEWAKDGIERLVQIYLANEEEETFSFRICAWKKRDGELHYKSILLKKRVPFAEIKDEIHQLLNDGYTTLESWIEEDLELIVA